MVNPTLMSTNHSIRMVHLLHHLGRLAMPVTTTDKPQGAVAVVATEMAGLEVEVVTITTTDRSTLKVSLTKTTVETVLKQNRRRQGGKRSAR